MTPIIILIVMVLLVVFLVRYCTRYNKRGFSRKGIHKNGTRYDDSGYDAKGYNRDGYNRQGYDIHGYDRQGFNSEGYNRMGKNIKGQYNRYYDMCRDKDGFIAPQWYPVVLTNHARDRIRERMKITDERSIAKIAQEAYCYGKSKRQIKKSSAALIEEIEGKYGNSVLLIHKGYIFIFSADNKLITVYKNDRIPL